MNIRRQRYKKYRLTGLSAYQSAIKAGYSVNTAKNATKKFEKDGNNFEAVLVKAGLDDDYLSRLIAEGTQATKVISAIVINKKNPIAVQDGELFDANEKTNDFIDVPDWPARHKFIETVLKMQGKLNLKIEHSGKVDGAETRIIIVRGEQTNDREDVPVNAEAGRRLRLVSE